MYHFRDVVFLDVLKYNYNSSCSTFIELFIKDSKFRVRVSAECICIEEYNVM